MRVDLLAHPLGIVLRWSIRDEQVTPRPATLQASGRDPAFGIAGLLGSIACSTPTARGCSRVATQPLFGRTVKGGTYRIVEMVCLGEPAVPSSSGKASFGESLVPVAELVVRDLTGLTLRQKALRILSGETSGLRVLTKSATSLPIANSAVRDTFIEYI